MQHHDNVRQYAFLQEENTHKYITRAPWQAENQQHNRLGCQDSSNEVLLLLYQRPYHVCRRGQDGTQETPSHVPVVRSTERHTSRKHRALSARDTLIIYWHLVCEMLSCEHAQCAVLSVPSPASSPSFVSPTPPQITFQNDWNSVFRFVFCVMDPAI